MLCGDVVSVWDIKQGGCQKCGGVRIRPSNLSLWEKLVQLCKHPKVWKWADEGAVLAPQGRDPGLG